jgi:ABC-2 type transport system permease protein
MRLFARLRWRLIRNGFRNRGAALIPTIASLVMALSVAVLAGAAGVASSSASFGDARTAVTVIAALLAAGALLLPVVVIGSDDSLSAARLSPFPLTTGERMAGWVGSTLAGPYGIATAVGSICLLIGRVRSLAGAPIAIVAAATLLVNVLIASRFLTTVLAPLMAGRRGRDLGVMIGALLGMSGWVFSQASRSLSGVSQQRWRSLASMFRWVPPGAAGRAIVESGAGHLASGAMSALLALGGLVAFVAAWRWAVARIDTGIGSGDQSAGSSQVGKSIFSGQRRRLPRTIPGAVAARELTYAARDPKWRVAVLSSLIIGTVLPVANVLSGSRSPELTLLGAASGLLGALNIFNVVGYEGRALWIHLLSGIKSRDYLRGKSLAIFVLFAPGAVFTVVVLAAITGGWRYLPAGVLLGLGALGSGIGIGLLPSVVSPIPPAESSNPFAIASGKGCATGMLSLVAMVLLAFVQSPAAIALFFVRHSALACVGVAVANIGIAVLVWRLGLRLAAARMQGREPELQALVVPVG